MFNFAKHGDMIAIWQILTRMEAKLDVLISQERNIMKTLDDIITETTRQGTIEDGLETLLTGLKAQIDAAGGNQAKIDAAFSALQKNNDRAAAALVAGTPAAAA